MQISNPQTFILITTTHSRAQNPKNIVFDNGPFLNKSPLEPYHNLPNFNNYFKKGKSENGYRFKNIVQQNYNYFKLTYLFPQDTSLLEIELTKGLQVTLRHVLAPIVSLRYLNKRLSCLQCKNFHHTKKKQDSH